MSEIKNYLKSFENTNDLINNLKSNNLIVKEKNNLILVKYKQKLKLTNPIFLHCRGLIFDKHTREIINFPMSGSTAFNNFIKNIPFSDCVIEESIDGTLINLYWYNGKWNTSTKSCIDAECKWKSDKTFHELFNLTVQNTNLDFTKLNTNFCYSFILCHPENINITQYNSPKLYHIFSRNLNNFKEFNLNIGVAKPFILKINKYNMHSVNDYNELVEKVNSFNFEKEGFMIFSKNRKFRVKLKNEYFLKAQSLKGNYNHHYYSIIKNLQNKKEYLGFFPEDHKYFNEVELNKTKLIDIVYNYYIKTKKLRLNINIPVIYRKAVIEIHKIYKSKYDEGYNNPSISKIDVMIYFNKMIDIHYFVQLLIHM